MPEKLPQFAFSPGGREVIGRMMNGEAVDPALRESLSGDDMEGIGELLNSGRLKVTPPGTVRYGNIASETGAALGRGAMNLGAVPYDALAGAAGTVASVQNTLTGRGMSRPSWQEQAVTPGLTGRALELSRLDQAIADNQRLLDSTREGDGTQPTGFLDSTFLRGQTTAQRGSEQERIKARIQELSARRSELATLTGPEALAQGAYQAGTKVRDAAEGVFPPSAADAVPGERAWYNPQRLLNVTAENAPQLAAQVAIAYATGGASAAGQGATQAARVAGFVGSGAAMELADATRSQTEGLKRQGMEEIDAIVAGAPSAALTAAVNSVLERMDAAALLPADAAGREAVKQGLMQQARARIVDGLKGGAAEGATEIGQELVGAGMESASGADPNALDPSTLLPRLATAGIAGLGPGAVAGGIAGAVEQRATQNPPQATGEPQQPQRGDLTLVAAPGGGVVGEVGQPVAGVPEQGQSVPDDGELGKQAAAMLAEAEAIGREHAGMGLPPEDMPDLEAPLRGAYMDGYRSVKPKRAGERTNVPDPNRVPQPPVPAADQGRGVEDADADAPAIRPVGAGVAPVVPEGGAVPVPQPGDVGAVEPQAMTNDQLRAEAERLGVKPTKNRVTMIGRIREARNATSGQVGATGAPAVDDVGVRALGGVGDGNKPANTQPVGEVAGSNLTDGQLRERLAAEGLNLSPKIKRPAMLSALDSIEQAAKQRLATRTIPRGRNVGASIIGAELRDRAIIAAVRVVKAGVRTAEAIHEAVRAVAKELGVTHTDEQHRQAFNEARRIIRAAGEKGESIEQAVADSHARHPDSTPESPIPAASTKSTVINTTGQRDTADAPTVPERKALASNLRAQERAGKAGFAAGVTEGKAKAEAAAKPRETVKQRIARVAGLTDDGDAKTVSQREALKATMKAQRRAARDAYAAAVVEFEAKVDAMRGKEGEAKANRLRLKKLVKDLLPPQLHARFLNAIATAKTDKQVDSAADRVLLTLTQFRASEARAKAQKLANKIDPSKAWEGSMEVGDDQAEPIGSVMQKQQDEIKRLSAALTAERGRSAEAEARIRQIKDDNARAVASVKMMGERADRLNALRNQLESARNRLLEANAADRAQKEIWSQGKKLEREAVISDTVENAKRRKPLQNLKKLGADPETPRFQRILRSLMNRATIGQLLGGRLRTMIVDDVWDGESKTYELWMEGRAAIQKAAENAGLEWGSEDLRKISAMTFGDKAERLAIELDGQTVEATPAEWMTLYALLGDEGHGHNLRHGAPIVFARNKITGKPVPMGRTNANAVIRQIPDELKKVVDDAKRWYAKNVTPKEAEAFREHFGHAMDRFHGYFRGKRQSKAPAAKEKDMLGQGDAGGVSPGSEPRLSGMGAWKLRDETAIKTPYVIGDFFAEFDSMVKESSARIHLNKTVRSLGSLLQDDTVQAALTGAYGLNIRQVLAEMVNESAVVFRRPRVKSGFNAALSGLSRNIARAYLSIAPSPALKNIGGVFKLGAVIDPKYLAPASKEILSKSVYQRMVDASAFLRYRHEQSAALRSYNATQNLESDLLGPPSLGEMAKRGRAGELADRSKMMDWSDARASVVAFRAFELQVEAEHPDWSKADKLAWVTKQTERAIRLTQNPTTTIDKTRVAARHVDDLVSSLLMFRSDSLASLNLLLQGGMESPKAFLRNLAAVELNHAWAAAVSAGLTAGVTMLGAAAGGNEEDEEFRKNRRGFLETFGKEFGANNLGLIPYSSEVGEVGTGLYNAATGEGAARGMDFNVSPVTRAITGTLEGMGKAARGIYNASNAETEKDAARAQKAWIGGLYDTAANGATVAGLPLQPTAVLIKRLITGATADADPGEVYKAIGDALKDNAPNRAERAMAILLRGQPREDMLKQAASARTALRKLGPRGKRTNEQWAARLAEQPDGGDRLAAEQDAWDEKVIAAIDAAFAKVDPEGQP